MAKIDKLKEIGSLEFNPQRAATFLKRIVNATFEEGEEMYDLPDEIEDARIPDLVCAIKILEDHAPNIIHFLDDEEEEK